MRSLSQLLSNNTDMKYNEVVELLNMGYPLYWANHNFKLFILNGEVFKQNTLTSEIKPLKTFESCDCFILKPINQLTKLNFI